MNSKQRRKLKREFRYIITIVANHGVKYYKHDMKIIDAMDWCHKHIKQYKARIDWDKTNFYFNDSKDATLFSLIWV